MYKGKVPGVYDDWKECRRQVHHFSGNSYKGYNTLAEAETRYANYLARERTREMERSRMTTFLVMMLTAASVFLFYVFLV
jgi:viroplasmin and RNaseH domain-containing protein